MANSDVGAQQQRNVSVISSIHGHSTFWSIDWLKYGARRLTECGTCGRSA